ncbi:MAG: hypothetical protein KF698_08310 [Anaerolineales bacterium]|nr:hypothetical protein [Anaerolineales bacterium]
MAAYADYDFYTDVYLGAAIAEEAFDALALRASEVIDAMTFQRAANVPEEDEATRILLGKACCAAAEVLNMAQQAGGVVGVQAERLGNYSVTYAASSDKQLSTSQQVELAVSKYLLGTGLMFRGFYEGEYGR